MTSCACGNSLIFVLCGRSCIAHLVVLYFLILQVQ